MKYKIHKNMISIATLLLISLLTINIEKIQASTLKLTIQTNKSEYNIEEKVLISGSLTQDGYPVTNALIGIQVNDPSDNPIVFRTLHTGQPPTTSSVEIMELYPCDDIGNPKYSFKLGTLASFKVAAKNNHYEQLYVVLTLTACYEPSSIPFTAIVFMTGYIGAGKTLSTIIYIPIPLDAPVGSAKVYVNAYTYLPSSLGVPYCPEASSSFLITASEGMSTTGIKQYSESYSISMGAYNFTFEIPESAKLGRYTAYACTKYGRDMSFAYTSFNVMRQTRLKIVPRYNIAKFEEMVNLTLSVFDVGNLTSWEVKIYYSSNILNATQVSEGSFLSAIGTTTFTIYQFTDNYNSTHGIIWLNCSLIPRQIGASGSGVLAKITFKIKAPQGGSWIYLEATKLADNKIPPNDILHTDINGFIAVGTHDIAITRIMVYKVIVGTGSLLPIYVTVNNNGHYTENFNITIYANTTAIQTNTLTLESGQSIIIKLWCNFSLDLYKKYLISAYATPVPEEINIDDNLYTDGIIIPVIQGDINADKIVDVFDAVVLAAAAGSLLGSPGWDSNCDLNCDGIVDIFDAVLLAANAGKQA